MAEEILDEVIKEMKISGEDNKKNFAELRKAVEQLKEELSQLAKDADALTAGKIEKLSAEIALRQNELDKKNAITAKAAQDRIDNVETILKRPSMGSQSSDQDSKDAKYFAQLCAVAGKKNTSYKGISEKDISVDAMYAYNKVFEYFLRMPDAKNMMSPDEVKALSVGSDPDGGYTVTPYMSNVIKQRIFERDPVRQLCRIEHITTEAYEEMINWNDSDAGWEGETIAGSETSTPDFNKKRIPVHVMYAKPRATQTLLEDSIMNVELWLGNKIADRFERLEGAAFINGDGVSKPKGMLTYANGTGYGQVEQVNLGHATQVTADGLISLKFTLKESYLNRCSMLMNRTTVAAIMKLKTGAGDYIWKPGLTEIAPSTILGCPVRMSTSIPSIAANSLSIICAEFQEAYCIVDRLGISVQRDPYTVKPFIEFYSRQRQGADITNFEAIKIGKISA